MAKKIIVDKVVVLRAVVGARTEKDAFKKYAELAGRKTLVEAEKVAVSAAFVKHEESERARSLREYNIRIVVEAEKAAEFAPVVEQYRKTISQFLTIQLDGKGTFTIDLTERLLRVVVKMPAFWSDSVTVVSHLDRQAVFDISYGFGGQNADVSNLDATRQKAFALNVACDLVEKLSGLDWAPFVRYSRDLSERVYAKLKEIR